MRSSNNVLHHFLVCRAILTELRSVKGDDVRLPISVLEDTGSGANAFVEVSASKC
jgi:hypothetical protein